MLFLLNSHDYKIYEGLIQSSIYSILKPHNSYISFNKNNRSNLKTAYGAVTWAATFEIFQESLWKACY